VAMTDECKKNEAEKPNPQLIS